jgi:peptidoglycan pentaglycine glycine transferase (the first glycine)
VPEFQPDPRAWDTFVRAQPRAHVLQLSAWGKLKAAYGWSAEIAAICEHDRMIAGAQLLFRRLPLRLGTMAYLPMGFYAPPECESALWSEIDACARRHRAAFLKWEPGFIDRTPEQIAALGFRPSPQTIQPPRTILIDLDDDETMLARMNQGTRRKIRQSQKNGIIYKEATQDEVSKFTAMMQITGIRGDFGVHEPGYYALAYDLFVPHDAALILAEHEGDTLAGIMVFAAGKTAWYLYGASSNQKRNLMASYGVQWAAIQWAKQRGCAVYDLWGIPDADETTLEAEFERRDDGLWGVYGFKRGWGGRVERSAGAWDRVYNPLIYFAYQQALKRRSHADRNNG